MIRAFLTFLLLCVAAPAQIYFHPAVQLLPTKFPEPRGVWAIFNPVVDPFVWIDPYPGPTLEVNKIAFLHPSGWTGACSPRFNSVQVINLNPTLFGWSSFYVWPKSPFELQIESTKVLLPRVSGYGVDYGNYFGPTPCSIGGTVYHRPLLVAVLLALR